MMNNMGLILRSRKGELTRRDFFKLGLGGAVVISGACKSESPTGPGLPVPVTLQFEVYNHTKGYKTSFTRNTTSGQLVNIKISDIGINDIDPERIAVREKNMGNLANFSTTGEANFTAPRQNMNYDIFLMNTSYGTDYYLIDKQKNRWGKYAGSLYNAGRYITVSKSDDGKTGPQEAIDDVISQFNAALNPGSIKYGTITQVASNGIITMGYGICLSEGVPVGGMTSDNHIWINPDVCRDTGRNIIGVFIEELFEHVIGVSDIHGDGSHVNGQDRYLTTEGKELWAYVFAKDERTQ